MTLLKMEGLYADIYTHGGAIRAIDGISLEIGRGESLCLVGESGCGKTMVALSIMQLLPKNFKIGGNIWFNGNDLMGKQEFEIRKIRGKDISMVFEQPATCLNPVITVGDQIAEVIRTHQGCSPCESRERAIKLLNTVGINAASKRYYQYPHEFSGGMQQRVMIGIAIANSPLLLIADEPTTSLDMPIQMQIIELLQELTAGLNRSLLLITHDLDMARRLCSRIIVMYAGEVVEAGNMEQLFSQPAHPYTQALLAATNGCLPLQMEGQVPELTNMPEGCRFHLRCPHAIEKCRHEKPPLTTGVRCHLTINP